VGGSVYSLVPVFPTLALRVTPKQNPICTKEDDPVRIVGRPNKYVVMWNSQRLRSKSLWPGTEDADLIPPTLTF
jgi:hypothetical protein